jgi:hypothetical protein
MGCDAAQGWHFSKPLSPAQATTWLARHAGHSRLPAQRAAARTISIPRPGSPAAPPPAAARPPASAACPPVGAPRSPGGFTP